MLEIKLIVTEKYRDQIDNKLWKYEDWINIKYWDQFKISIESKIFCNCEWPIQGCSIK